MPRHLHPSGVIPPMATKKTTTSTNGTPRKTAARKKTTDTPETPVATSSGGAAVQTARETAPASTTTADVSRSATPNFDQTADIQERIRQRAYQLFEQRGGQHGFDIEDWVKAEAEINRRR